MKTLPFYLESKRLAAYDERILKFKQARDHKYYEWQLALTQQKTALTAVFLYYQKVYRVSVSATRRPPALRLTSAKIVSSGANQVFFIFIIPI